MRRGLDDDEPDEHGNRYFWLPVVTPIIDGLLGAALCQFFINRHLVVAEAEAKPQPVGRHVSQ